MAFKKRFANKLFYGGFIRSEHRFVFGSVRVEAQSGSTLFIEQIDETRRRCGVTIDSLDIVDTGKYGFPLVFSLSMAEAKKALRGFFSAEARASTSALDYLGVPLDEEENDNDNPEDGLAAVEEDASIIGV